MRIENPFHEGELDAQRRAGVLELGKRNGRAIADSILPGALRFIEQQSFVILGHKDEAGDLWTTVIIGEAGFIRPLSESTIELNYSGVDRNAVTTLDGLPDGSRLGLLIIELATRRRLRVNGVLKKREEKVLELRVEESYPNCPKYIQSRHLTIERAETSSQSEQGEDLGATQRALIGNADTFFVSSLHPERGVDASHRGGQRGFVQLLDDGRLRIPDYPGNSMFNTLGNFLVYPRAGLTFVDFENSIFLQLTGEVTVHWDLNDSKGLTGGTQRFWDFQVSRWKQSEFSFKLTWEHLSDSPYNILRTSH